MSGVVYVKPLDPILVHSRVGHVSNFAIIVIVLPASMSWQRAPNIRVRGGNGGWVVVVWWWLLFSH